jgi:COMPASS component SWD2
MIKLIDSYNGATLQSFTGHLNSKNLPLEASFSPDSQFVISGSTDGRIHIWNAENGQKVCVLNGDHKSAVQCVLFNPKYMMMASACSSMSFWLPNIDDEVN